MLTDQQKAVLVEALHAGGRIERERMHRSTRTLTLGEKLTFHKLVELGLATVCTVNRSWWKGSVAEQRFNGARVAPSTTYELTLTPQGWDVALAVEGT